MIQGSHLQMRMNINISEIDSQLQAIPRMKAEPIRRSADVYSQRELGDRLAETREIGDDGVTRLRPFVETMLPVDTTMPARSGRPRSASVLAIQASASSGWPSTSAPTPCPTSTP